MRRRRVGDQMLSFYRRVGEDRYRERHGLPFAAFAPGQRFRHRPGVTLSQQDNVEEALDTLNGAMLHFDAPYAAATSWQRPLMVSTLTIQRIVGMASKTYAGRRTILDFPEIVLNGPVFGGDTLYAESEVLGADPADRVLTVRLRGVKADGGEVGRLVCRMAFAPDPEDGEPVEDPRFAAYHPAEDGALVEQCGLFFEDLRAGETFIHAPRRSFYTEEVVAHAWRSLELSPARHELTAGGRMPVSEPFLIGAVTALTTRVFGRVAANLGWRDVALPQPVLAGDTIEAVSTILTTRESRSRPDEGLATVLTEAHNQDGAAVVRFTRTLLVYRRAAAAAVYTRAGY
jgi:itaconyl-CoA hydratase